MKITRLLHRDPLAVQAVLRSWRKLLILSDLGPENYSKIPCMLQAPACFCTKNAMTQLHIYLKYCSFIAEYRHGEVCKLQA